MERREEVMNNNTSTTTSSVTVVGSDAPSDHHISPTPPPNNQQLTIMEVGPTMAPPPLGVMPLSMKKKRGRPRKYGADGSVNNNAKALSPKPISSAAGSSPVIDFSTAKRGKVRLQSAGKHSPNVGLESLVSEDCQTEKIDILWGLVVGWVVTFGSVETWTRFECNVTK
ncbi:AT-hook motif nuclear-localized protein 1-like protein [Tanacetum coccineum]